MHSWINSIFIFVNTVVLIIILFYDKFSLLKIDWFSNGSIIENAYYIAGVTTIIAVIVSVLSLRTSKKTSEAKTRREIATATISACIDYSDNILSEIDEISEKFNGKSLDINILNINNAQISKCMAFIDEVDEEIFEKAAKVLNKIEGFTLYFEVGDLSINVAKKIVGKLICEHIEELSPIIVNTLSDKPEDYKELISFYKKMKC